MCNEDLLGGLRKQTYYFHSTSTIFACRGKAESYMKVSQKRANFVILSIVYKLDDRPLRLQSVMRREPVLAVVYPAGHGVHDG